MKCFVLGIGATVVVIVCAVWLVSHFGLYPIGADNHRADWSVDWPVAPWMCMPIDTSRPGTIRWCRRRPT